ncbi:MAG: type I glyceraldehyde-3-phosphate dehydrogenase [Pseudonocardia sp.]
MRTRVGINGMGRVGRGVLRALDAHPGRAFEVVAVNDLAPLETVAHLLRHDSTFGRWPGRIETGRGFLSLDGVPIRALTEAEPRQLPWADLGVDIVVESTGRFRERDQAGAHLVAGARKVVLTAPGRDADATVVMGINEDEYEPRVHDVVSNASCTTNCLAPMITVLHRGFGIRRGLMTTVHGYTADQNLLDAPHRDPRRARAAAVNVIPTSTGAARAVTAVLPELAGRLDGLALRVPVADVSLTDLTVQLNEVVTPAQVNRAFAEAAGGYLKSVLRYSTEPLVSTDLIGDPASCVFDAGLTVTTGTMVKVFGWYDNESGYAHRTVELVDLVARTLPDGDQP